MPTNEAGEATVVMNIMKRYGYHIGRYHLGDGDTFYQLEVPHVDMAIPTGASVSDSAVNELIDTGFLTHDNFHKSLRPTVLHSQKVLMTEVYRVEVLYKSLAMLRSLIICTNKLRATAGKCGDWQRYDALFSAVDDFYYINFGFHVLDSDMIPTIQAIEPNE